MSMDRASTQEANDILSRIARKREIEILDVNVARQIIKATHDIDIYILEDDGILSSDFRNKLAPISIKLRGEDDERNDLILVPANTRVKPHQNRAIDLFKLIYQRYEYSHLNIKIFALFQEWARIEISPEELGTDFLKVVLSNMSPSVDISPQNVPIMQLFEINEFGKFESRSVGIGQQKNIVVPAENSLIGLTCKTKNPRVFDPRDPKYKKYYLNYSILPGFECKSELVVPLLNNESKVIGVINYESSVEDYFGEAHKRSLSRYNDILTDFAGYIFRQFKLAYDSPMINLQRQQQYFNAYCSSFSHDIQSLFKLGALTAGLTETIQALDRSTYDEVNAAASEHFSLLGKSSPLGKNVNLDEILARTEDAYNQTDALIAKHISRFQNVAAAKILNIKETIDEEIQIFRTIQKKEDEGVVIDVKNLVPEEIQLYEYTIVGSYIYQIMDNARKQIVKKARRLGPEFRGQITVSADIEPRFNGQWEDEFLFLRIKDNGPGMKPERLQRLRDSLPLGRASVGDNEDGTRRALAGVMAHMTSRGGWIDFRSRTGPSSYFEVCLVFDILRARDAVLEG